MLLETVIGYFKLNKQLEDINVFPFIANKRSTQLTTINLFYNACIEQARTTFLLFVIFLQ